MAITIQDLVNHTIYEIHRQEQRSNNWDRGEQPYYPMMIFYLGSSILQYHTDIVDNVLEPWPNFTDELHCIQLMDPYEESLRFGDIGYRDDQLTNNPEIGQKNLNEEDLNNLLDGLFDSENSFEHYERLLLYFILDTRDIHNENDFRSYMSAIEKIKNKYSKKSSSMLFVILDERTNAQETASMIKTNLASWYTTFEDESETPATESVFLLSNRKSDESMIVSNDGRGKLIASLILLSNEVDLRLFQNQVMTVKSSRQDKPYYDIGKIVVREMLQKLMGHLDRGDITYSVRDLYSNLRLTARGTFKMLDEYCDHLDDLNISEELLYAFPRRNTDDINGVANWTVEQFNRMTMGAWNAYIRSLVESVKNRALKDRNLTNGWRNEFRKYLQSTYDVGELIYLYDHVDEVRNLYRNGLRQPSEEDYVNQSASRIFKYEFSQSQEIQELFFGTIERVGKDAKDCMRELQLLVESGRRIDLVRDDMRTEHYSRITNSYLMTNGIELDNLIRVQTVDDLKVNFNALIHNIIGSDEIFGKSFENELTIILDKASNPVSAQNYIYTKLTTNVTQYLYTKTNLGSLLYSAVLLRAGTKFYEYLKKQNILQESDGWQYYDTLCDRFVESVQVYIVKPENLLM